MVGAGVDPDMPPTSANLSTDSKPAEPVRILENPKWIRGVKNGEVVVDSRSTKLVWDVPWYPAWYIPESDLAGAPPPGETRPELPGHIKVDWDWIDHWFEEDVEVFIHPRSPFTRVDTLATSRRVVVRIDGEVVADSVGATVLYETGLPPRWYLPALDVRLDLLTPTGTTTGCPYKGFASYWTATINGTTHADIVWSYATPLPESAGVAGLMCFYNEKVEIEIDGTVLAPPDTM